MTLGTTHAVAAGIADHAWSLEEFLENLAKCWEEGHNTLLGQCQAGGLPGGGAVCVAARGR